MLSVVVPIYNMEKYIKRCLDSLLNQTVSDYEILLIDDGSTDQSGAICMHYTEQYPERVRYVYKENGGLSSARNCGIEHADGDVIVFPDPDDWVEPEYVETLTENVSDKFDLVVGGHFLNTDIAQYGPAEEQFIRGIINSKEAREHLIIRPRVTGFAWDKAYRLDIIRSYNLKFADDVGATEDVDFAYRYLSVCSGNILVRPEKHIYHYYQRPDSASRGSFNPGKISGLNTYEKIISGTDNEDLIRETRAEIFVLSNQMSYEIYLIEEAGNSSWRQLRSYMRDNVSAVILSKFMSLQNKMKYLLCWIAPRIMYRIKKSRRVG